MEKEIKSLGRFYIGCGLFCYGLTDTWLVVMFIVSGIISILIAKDFK